MNKESPVKQKQIYFFQNSRNNEYFQQYILTLQPQNLISTIYSPDQQHIDKKIQALISGCIKRNNKQVYKGNKYYFQDLQFILQKYPQRAPTILRKFNFILDKNKKFIYVQCNHCADMTKIWKFCTICQHIHYCHQGCQMKSKLTHEKQQCRPRPFPQNYKALQIQLHVGSDIGQNVHLYFQHQANFSLLTKGQKLIQVIYIYFSQGQGKLLISDYEIKKDGSMIKFQNQIKDYQTGTQQVNIETIQQICQIYKKNKILSNIQLFLLQNGAILSKNIRQIHDNHVKQIYVFLYP